jgi:hypothetical protein
MVECEGYVWVVAEAEVAELCQFSNFSPRLLGTMYVARGSTPSGTTNPKYATLGRVVSMIFSGPVLLMHQEWQYQVPLSLSAHP